ncbi:MAG: beta-propeller domain-containing protein [Burkholderiaceae bacterium]
MLNRRIILAYSLTAGLALATLSACAVAPDTAALPAQGLAAYRNEAELTDALSRWRSAAEKLRGEARRSKAQSAGALGATAQSAAPSAMAKSADAATGAAAAESITNAQTAGVDEGGIVKRAGEHLIILRRGRLFTVRVGGDALQSAAMLDAFAPGIPPQGAWYDELLVSDSSVVVIGYSYARGGTEIGLFDLAANGSLSYRATYHLRSFDYYSSRNYASRLIGRKLVFYTPTLLHPWGPLPQQMFPGVRRWQGQAPAADFKRVLPATRVYRSDDEFDPQQPLALHSVTACDLGAAELNCEATAVLGPAGRVFYVSQGSVYVWTSASRNRRHTSLYAPEDPAPTALSAVFRIPLNGATPSALKTAGVPIDQMSFLEDDSAHLNVLLRESGAGEGMWGSEHSGGRMALLRVPLAAFGDGRGAAQREHYRSLPAPAGYSVQNRFVGAWLLWGSAGARYRAASSGRDQVDAWALRFADAGDAIALAPGHSVERIEALGEHAVLVGNAGIDLHFSSVRLSPIRAELAGRYAHPGASQGETRTHGFFYRPTARDAGLLGLPVLSAGAGRRAGVFSGAHGSASVLYLRQNELNFTALGELHAQPGAARDDACRASCVDWYGNARPIFLGNRVFALLGYELVEGELTRQGAHERIEERRRISFAPHATSPEGRYSPFN